jgi:rod shape determining protein RodA
MATITAPPRPRPAAPLTPRRRVTSETSPLRHLDLTLVALPFAISGLGLLMIFTASRNRLHASGLSELYYVERQGVAIVLGAIAMALVILVDYRRLRDMWALVYLATLPLLAGVLVIGRSHKGAQAWFQVGPMQFQPSEIAKVTVIVAIAGYCHQHRGDLDAWRLAVAVALASGVMALVFLQHDLGTTLVIMVCAGAVLLVAGLKPVHIAVLLLLAGTAVGAAVATGKVEAYRVDRLTNFVNQSTNGLSASRESQTQYSLSESKAAIASGGLTGTGIGKGRQTKNGFVPEQHTDFIFTAVGEELGFIGGAALIGLYALLAWRLWRIALLSSDFFGTLVAIGVLAMFAFQVFENIGMTMGIMPITGIPLPFMSYGGSAVIASFIAIGLTANIHMRRFS